jgi:hypothetical protein
MNYLQNKHPKNPKTSTPHPKACSKLINNENIVPRMPKDISKKLVAI